MSYLYYTYEDTELGSQRLKNNTDFSICHAEILNVTYTTKFQTWNNSIINTLNKTMIRTEIQYNTQLIPCSQYRYKKELIKQQFPGQINGQCNSVVSNPGAWVTKKFPC